MTQEAKMSLYLAILIILQSCASNNKVADVSMAPVLDCSQFESRIDSLCLIPLECSDNLVMGDGLEMCPADGLWILIDNKHKKIAKYAGDGTFLGMVGHRGKASSEYLTVQNVQVVDDTIIVYSFPNKIVRYSLNGKHIGSTSMDVDLGYQSFVNGELLYTYNGYLQKGKYRMSIVEDGTTQKQYLKTPGKVMHFESVDPVFFRSGERVIMTDSFSNSLYELSGDKCNEFLSFDFGEYSIDNSFFKSKDEFKSFEFLLNTVFARISRYLESSDMKCVSVSLDGKGQQQFIYGINDDSGWQWFQMGAPADNPLSGTLRLIENKCLVFLLESERINSLPATIIDRITYQGSIKSPCDYVIAKAYIH